jgi:hypothetical protein
MFFLDSNQIYGAFFCSVTMNSAFIYLMYVRMRTSYNIKIPGVFPKVSLKKHCTFWCKTLYFLSRVLLEQQPKSTRKRAKVSEFSRRIARRKIFFFGEIILRAGFCIYFSLRKGLLFCFHSFTFAPSPAFTVGIASFTFTAKD